MNNLTPEFRRDILALHKRTSRLRYDEVLDPKSVRNPLLSRDGGSYLNMNVLKIVMLDDESFSDKLKRQSESFMKSLERTVNN